MKIGVTGGIGSGKSSVCRVFNTLGIPVFDSDKEAQLVINSSRSVQTELNSIAGADLFSSGTLDRKLLANLIFNDGQMLLKVNELIHPLVFKRFEEWANEQKSPYCILESAILFESGAWKLVDMTISVTAPVDERIQRVLARNNLPRAEIEDRIRNQMDDNERILKSDFVIANGECDLIIPTVLNIHNSITNKIKASE